MPWLHNLVGRLSKLSSTSPRLPILGRLLRSLCTRAWLPAINRGFLAFSWMCEFPLISSVDSKGISRDESRLEVKCKSWSRWHSHSPIWKRPFRALPFSFNCAQAKASLASGNSLTAYSDLIVLPPTTDIPTRPRAADSITPDLRHQRILFLRHLPPG